MFIADFYCAKARLVIELDGSGHYSKEQSISDSKRTAAMEELNLKVMGIPNIEVDRNFRNVCEYIDCVVRESLPQSPAVIAPSEEGAEEVNLYNISLVPPSEEGEKAKELLINTEHRIYRRQL